MAQAWPWPEELDALVAAPDNHLRLLENDRVRVLQTHVPAGTRTPVHTHRWPSVGYVLQGSDFIRRDGTGDILFDTRSANDAPQASQALWAGPFAPHSLENVGGQELRVIMIELKDRC